MVMESGRLSFTNGWQTGVPRNHRHPDVFGRRRKARCTHRGMRRWPGWNGFGVLACVASGGEQIPGYQRGDFELPAGHSDGRYGL